MNKHTNRFVQTMLDRSAVDTPELPVAKVTAFASGVVTVDYRGASLQLPYLSGYSPVVNDVVVLARVGGHWLILGKPTGYP